MLKKRQKEKPKGYYRDDEGRTRPITSKNVRAALAKGIVIRKVVDKEGHTVQTEAARAQAEVETRPFEPSEGYEQQIINLLDEDYLRREGLFRAVDGWVLDSPSSSTPGKKYQTIFWTESTGRFKRGEFTCNCPGWIFSKKDPKSCKHTKHMRSLIFQAHSRYNTAHPPTRRGPAHGLVGVFQLGETYDRFEKVFPNNDKTNTTGMVLTDNHEMGIVTDPATIPFCREIFDGKAQAQFYNKIPTSAVKGSLDPSTIQGQLKPQGCDMIILPKGTMIKKSNLEGALKVLGYSQIFVFDEGNDMPIVVANSKGESFVIAPMIGTTDYGFTKLGDVAK